YPLGRPDHSYDQASQVDPADDRALPSVIAEVGACCSQLWELFGWRTNGHKRADPSHRNRQPLLQSTRTRLYDEAPGLCVCKRPESYQVGSEHLIILEGPQVKDGRPQVMLEQFV